MPRRKNRTRSRGEVEVEKEEKQQIRINRGKAKIAEKRHKKQQKENICLREAVELRKKKS